MTIPHLTCHIATPLFHNLRSVIADNLFLIVFIFTTSSLTTINQDYQEDLIHIVRNGGVTLVLG